MAARPRTLPAAIAPVLVGTAAAIELVGELPRFGALIAALVGSIFIQIGTNLANDYSDAKRGADAVERLGPVRVTAAGLVAPQRVLVATWLAFAVAVAAGIYLATVAGWVIIAVGVASIAAGVLYHRRPAPLRLRRSRRAVRLPLLRPRRRQRLLLRPARGLEWLPFGLSVAVGCLATAILVVNNVRDIETDRRAGKTRSPSESGEPTRAPIPRTGRTRLRHPRRHPGGGGRAVVGPSRPDLGTARCPADPEVMTRTDGPALNAALAGTGALLGRSASPCRPVC